MQTTKIRMPEDSLDEPDVQTCPVEGLHQVPGHQVASTSSEGGVDRVEDCALGRNKIRNRIRNRRTESNHGVETASDLLSDGLGSTVGTVLDTSSYHVSRVRVDSLKVGPQEGKVDKDVVVCFHHLGRRLHFRPNSPGRYLPTGPVDSRSPPISFHRWFSGSGSVQEK